MEMGAWVEGVLLDWLSQHSLVQLRVRVVWPWLLACICLVEGITGVWC